MFQPLSRESGDETTRLVALLWSLPEIDEHLILLVCFALPASNVGMSLGSTRIDILELIVY